jgi:hypothetical protein
MTEISDPKERAALEQSIIDEGRQLFESNDPSWPGFLNNFIKDVLPIGSQLHRSGRDQAEQLGWWNKKFSQVIDPTEQQNFSKLKMSQTSREFFETIDRVISEVDTTGELRQLLLQFDDNSVNRNFETNSNLFKEIERRLILVFARLVAMGYERYDLTI